MTTKTGETKGADPDDPVTNLALPATRLQQAERVHVVVGLLQSAKSKARLRRLFRRHSDKFVKQLARDYSMHGLYQVRPLALFDVTYAGSVGVIMSYIPGGVTFSVFYDRPGHKYTDPQLRTPIDPIWLEAITLEQFDAIAVKDNRLVVSKEELC